MSGIATAVVGGAVVGGIIQSQGAQSAAATEASAANNATATDWNIFQQQEADEAPYRQAGEDALSQIQSNMSTYNQPYTMGMFQEDPGYQFDLQQGQQAVQNSSAAQGHMISSQELGNASTYSENMASNEFNNAYSRYQSQISNSYNRLASLAQLGQTGVANTNAAASTAGTNISNAQIGAGNAAAAGQIGTANAISGGISSASNGFMNYNMMNNLFGGGTTGGGAAAGIGNLNGSANLQNPSLGTSAGFGDGGSMASLLPGS